LNALARAVSGTARLNAIRRKLRAQEENISRRGFCPVRLFQPRWIRVVIMLLDVLMLATISMVHMDRRRTAAINMFSLATGIAACLVLLMVHDRPFSIGGFTLEPVLLRNLEITG
jgi:hypothetical protein